MDECCYGTHISQINSCINFEDYLIQPSTKNTYANEIAQTPGLNNHLQTLSEDSMPYKNIQAIIDYFSFFFYMRIQVETHHPPSNYGLIQQLEPNEYTYSYPKLSTHAIEVQQPQIFLITQNSLPLPHYNYSPHEPLIIQQPYLQQLTPAPVNSVQAQHPKDTKRPQKRRSILKTSNNKIKSINPTIMDSHKELEQKLQNLAQKVRSNEIRFGPERAAEFSSLLDRVQQLKMV